jgi:hypothetical protein
MKRGTTATISMARGDGGHAGAAGGNHAASSHGLAASVPGSVPGYTAYSTGRRDGDDCFTDPYFCEPYPSDGSRYLGTDGILPYCP